MNKIIHRVLAGYLASKEGQEALRHIAIMKDHPGWNKYQTILMEMGNYLANAAISKEFQKLDDKDKLIRLEAYSMMSDFIKFAINPLPNIERIIAIQKHNEDASRRGIRKEKQDGRKSKSFPRAVAT
jgi:hypothetical protein